MLYNLPSSTVITSKKSQKATSTDLKDSTGKIEEKIVPEGMKAIGAASDDVIKSTSENKMSTNPDLDFHGNFISTRNT